MNYEEQDYVNALVKINELDFDEKKWLIDNFELYKSTLNWPSFLSPINRSNLVEGTINKKFNSFYYKLLNDYNFEFDNNYKLLFLYEKVK